MYGTNHEFLMSLKSSVFLVIVSDINMLVDLIKTNKATKQTHTWNAPCPTPNCQKTLWKMTLKARWQRILPQIFSSSLCVLLGKGVNAENVLRKKEYVAM